MPTRARTTPYAVLGLLRIRPMSGYDLRKEAASSVGFFWSESYGQLYPALRELTAAGLIRRRPDEQTGGRERQVYEITKKGRRALDRWRAEPPRDAPVRSELLLKLFLGDPRSVSPEIAWIEDRLARETAALREFRRIRGELGERKDQPSLPFWLMTLSYGEHRSRAVVRWCRETRRTLLAMTKARGVGR